MWNGAQLAVDTTIVSPLMREAVPRLTLPAPSLCLMPGVRRSGLTPSSFGRPGAAWSSLVSVDDGALRLPTSCGSLPGQGHLAVLP